MVFTPGLAKNISLILTQLTDTVTDMVIMEHVGDILIFPISFL